MKIYIALALIVVFSLGSSASFELSKYQGRTAQDWAKKANQNKSESNYWEKVAFACSKDPSSRECFSHSDPIISAFNDALPAYNGNCNNKIVTSADIVWHYKNCSNTISTPSVNASGYVPQAKPSNQFTGWGVDTSGYQQVLMNKATQILNNYNP